MVCRKWYNASQDLQFQVKRRAAAPYETSGWRSRAPGARVLLRVCLSFPQRHVTFCFPASASSLELIRGLGRRSFCRLSISQLDGFSVSRLLLQEVRTHSRRWEKRFPARVNAQMQVWNNRGAVVVVVVVVVRGLNASLGRLLLARRSGHVQDALKGLCPSVVPGNASGSVDEEKEVWAGWVDVSQ